MQFVFTLMYLEWALTIYSCQQRQTDTLIETHFTDKQFFLFGWFTALSSTRFVMAPFERGTPSRTPQPWHYITALRGADGPTGNVMTPLQKTQSKQWADDRDVIIECRCKWQPVMIRLFSHCGWHRLPVSPQSQSGNRYRMDGIKSHYHRQKVPGKIVFIDVRDIFWKRFGDLSVGGNKRTSGNCGIICLCIAGIFMHFRERVENLALDEGWIW